MDRELLRWLLPLSVAVLGFLLGGGWPLKAFRRMGELDLIDRMKEHFWTRAEQGAFERQNDMRHDRSDEIVKMLHDAQAANTALSGAVERHTEALKYLGDEMREVRDDVETLKRARTASS